MKYNDRIINIDNGTFTPLIFSVTGSTAPECNVFYRKLCTKLAEKSDERYSDMMNWVKCKISFLCLRVALTCVRGSRTKRVNDQYISDDFSYDISASCIRS